MTSNTQFKDMHIFEDANDPGAIMTRAPQSYVVLCKDPNCRQFWYAEESFKNYQIRKRLSSTPSYVDGATLQRYTRPSKAWENLFCSFPENKRECRYKNGFDPAVPNIPSEAFEVKQSSIGLNVGRGVFTKVDIAEGSYFMQETAVHRVKFSVQSFSVILKTKDMMLEIDCKSSFNGIYYGEIEEQEHGYEIDSVISFMDGYGEDDDTLGSTHNVVDSGFSAFVNHGCNKTFNYGPVFFVLDREAGITKSEYEYLLLSEEEADPNIPQVNRDRNEKLFNPLVERHMEHDISCYDGSISNISKGQELFTNYVHYYGIGGWKYGINDLRSQCRGEKIGFVVQIEGTGVN
jgi:hypothetical protein